MEKIQETEIPITVDPGKCLNCMLCPPMEDCPNTAFYRNRRVRVDPLKCNACKICIGKCEYDAVSFGKKVRINIRDVDLENTRRLKGMEGVKVIKKLDEIGL
jgi:flavoprotein